PPSGYNKTTPNPATNLDYYGLTSDATLKSPPAAAGKNRVTMNIGNNFGVNPKANDTDNKWDWLVFNDRDFTSVAELMMVPGCPPGLFTKQFVEAVPNSTTATNSYWANVYTGWITTYGTTPPKSSDDPSTKGGGGGYMFPNSTQ